MSKIYIAGAGGMLGAAFYEIFSIDNDIRCTDIDVNSHWLSYLDFRDLHAYRKDVADFRSDMLFHLGAFTDLEFCEEHPNDTYSTNTMAVENACYIANELDIPLLYISTAGIFDGKKELYDDWDIPAPLGHYARSKYAGEVFVKENVRKHLICRAGWMMGGGPAKDKKFVQKIMRQLKDGKSELFIVDDKLGTPTYTRDFAYNVKILLENRAWGLYNMVCGGVTGRVEVTQEILRLLGLEDSVRIHAVPSDYFKFEYFVQRPASERLINQKLILRGMNKMRDWKVGLAEYLAADYQGYLDHRR